MKDSHFFVFTETKHKSSRRIYRSEQEKEIWNVSLNSSLDTRKHFSGKASTLLLTHGAMTAHSGGFSAQLWLCVTSGLCTSGLLVCLNCSLSARNFLLLLSGCHCWSVYFNLFCLVLMVKEHRLLIIILSSFTVKANSDIMPGITGNTCFALWYVLPSW